MVSVVPQLLQRWSVFLLLLLQSRVVSSFSSSFRTSAKSSSSLATTLREPSFLSAQTNIRPGFSSLYYRDRDDAEDVLTNTGRVPAQERGHQEHSQQNSVSSVDDVSTEALVNANNAKKNGISMPLIKAIWFNQATILLLATATAAGASFAAGGGLGNLASLHWNAGASFFSLFDWRPFFPFRLVEGILAAIPVISLSAAVERSDHREASHVSFSTTNMVISLFGRRRTQQEPSATTTSQVIGLSSVIALTTSISEELLFRGYIPAAILGMTSSLPVALAGSAGLFALGHVSPRSSAGENKVVGSLQFLNGLWYGLVYLMTGGDILPCIVAHLIYDMHVFCQTWHSINTQMDYTQEAFRKQLPESEEVAIQKIQEEAGPALNTETLNFAKRFFYAFDYEHKGTLSLSDCQRAISYAFMQDEAFPPAHEVSEMCKAVLESRESSKNSQPDRLSVSEFLRVLFALKAQNWAATA
jgi:membrane protease YdiL (CAAX protease family)